MKVSKGKSYFKCLCCCLRSFGQEEEISKYKATVVSRIKDSNLELNGENLSVSLAEEHQEKSGK